MTDTLTLVGNFVALSGINDFDEVIFKVFQNAEFSKLVREGTSLPLKFECFRKVKKKVKWMKFKKAEKA